MAVNIFQPAGASGNHDVAGNWSLGHVPDQVNNDTPQIAANKTLNVVADWNVKYFPIGNGTYLTCAMVIAAKCVVGVNTATTVTNLTLTITPSGDKTDPSGIEAQNCIVTFGTTCVPIFDGTAGQYDTVNAQADIVLRGTGAASGFAITTTPHIQSGGYFRNLIIQDCTASYPWQGIQNMYIVNPYNNPVVGPFMMNNNGSTNYGSTQFYIVLSGDLTIDDGASVIGTYDPYNSRFYGNFNVVYKAITTAGKRSANTCEFHNNVKIVRPGANGLFVSSCKFYDSSGVVVTDGNYNSVVNGYISGSDFYGNSTIDIDDDTNNNTVVINNSNWLSQGRLKYVKTTNQIARVFMAMSDIDAYDIYIDSAGTLYLLCNGTAQYYMPSNVFLRCDPERIIRIINSPSINLYDTTPSNHFPINEPLMYHKHATNYDNFTIQCELYWACKNRDNIYKHSGWTWNSGDTMGGTLADGGYFEVDLSGILVDFPEWRVSFLSQFGFSTLGSVGSTGTAIATCTHAYYVSHDGGLTWSDPLTLAQLQTGAYSINGDGYTVNPYQPVMLRWRITNGTGVAKTITRMVFSTLRLDGTVTAVRTLFGMHDLTHDRQGIPVAIDGGTADHSSMISKLADDAGGTAFDATTDSQRAISAKIGTPVALDGGAADISSMLTKMSDDNGGADFDSTFDSLHEISSGFGGVVRNLSKKVDGLIDLSSSILQYCKNIWTKLKNWPEYGASKQDVDNASRIVDGDVSKIQKSVDLQTGKIMAEFKVLQKQIDSLSGKVGQNGK